MEIRVKKLYEGARIPERAHPSDAGLDLFTLSAELVVGGEGPKLIGTGISVAIPEGYVGLIWDKSGVATKQGLKVLGGVIDSGYRGEIMVAVFAYRHDSVVPIEYGQKIAQLLIQKIETPTLLEVEELDGTERGEKGFGSTGV